MRELARRVLTARRKGWIRSRPLFEPHAPATEPDLAAAAARVGRALSPALKSWLTLVGYGDIDRSLSFRSEWLEPVEAGELKGGLRFAQDELGNFYAIGPDNERVVFFARSEPAYAVLAPSFEAFLCELERRDFKVIDWVQSLELAPYAWSAA